MIYFFGGENRDESFKKAFALFENLKKKKPDASFVSVEAQNVDESFLDEVLGSQGLFEKKLVVFLKEPLSNKESKKNTISRVKEFKSSENIFVWVEGDLAEKEQKVLVENSEKHLLSKAVSSSKEKFNTFSITDAFGKRNKKEFWTLFLEAKQCGISAEEIHGVLFWQAKAIALAEKETLSGSGMKPFAYTKAKNFSKNFSPEEIQKMLTHLVKMFHEAHRGNIDFDLSLEEFALLV